MGHPSNADSEQIIAKALSIPKLNCATYKTLPALWQKYLWSVSGDLSLAGVLRCAQNDPSNKYCPFEDAAAWKSGGEASDRATAPLNEKSFEWATRPMLTVSKRIAKALSIPKLNCATYKTLRACRQKCLWSASGDLSLAGVLRCAQNDPSNKYCPFENAAGWKSGGEAAKLDYFK